MLIPSRTKLAGITITTEYDTTLAKTHGVYGVADYTKQKIVLDNSVVSQQTLEQAYIHELIHWILYILNKTELRNDEDTVDSIAHLMYQAIEEMQHTEAVCDQSIKSSGLD